MPRRWCNKCLKSFSCRQSLSVHKKKCGNGSTIPLPAKIPNSGKEELTRILDGVSPIKKKEELSDSEDSDTESDKEDDVLWERFAMFCNRTDTDIFEYLEDIIELYLWSKKDDLFENIMDDMVEIKNLGYSLGDAADFAVCKHREDIIDAVRDCGDIDLEKFWYGLSLRDIQDGCIWFTGEKCYCDECKGRSLLKKVAVFVKKFYAIDHDKIIQKIVKDGGIEKSIQRHSEEILERFKQAQNLIETLGIIDDPNRPKFNWKCDTESVSESGSGMRLNPFVVH